MTWPGRRMRTYAITVWVAALILGVHAPSSAESGSFGVSDEAGVEAEEPAAPEAAGPGDYSAPTWLPLRANASIGCTYADCSGGYHPYWALDFLDPANAAGDPIYAAGAGQAFIGGNDSKCYEDTTHAGRWVYINHDANGTVRTRYLHLNTISITNGQWVTPNTKIGTMGSTGSNIPCPTNHLHYEKQVNGTKVDPGSLKACHGSKLVSYPQEVGFSTWVGSVGTVHSDGTGCEDPPEACPDIAAVNNGFESGTSPWKKINKASKVNIQTYTNSSFAHQGSRYMEANTSESGGSVGQDINQVPKKDCHYKMRVWARSRTGQPVTVRPAMWALGGTQESNGTTVTVEERWTPIDVVLSVNNGGHTKLRTEFYMQTTGKNIDFDYVTIGESTSAFSHSNDPRGAYEAASSPDYNKVRVAGWAFDPNYPLKALTIHAYVGGQSGSPGVEINNLGAAGDARSDVESSYPYAGRNHGFDVTFSTSKTGTQPVCVYAIDYGAGSNKLLGCKNVTIDVEPPTMCDGRVATIVGTDGPETIDGTDGPDVIAALGGNDIIRGGDGNDVICAGSGNDEVWGGSGKDVIRGGQGNDLLIGGGGRDRLHGRSGDDTLKGGGGGDRLSGNAGIDDLFGNKGDDRLRGGSGVDSCAGGPGIDAAGNCEALKSIEAALHPI